MGNMIFFILYIKYLSNFFDRISNNFHLEYFAESETPERTQILDISRRLQYLKTFPKGFGNVDLFPKASGMLSFSRRLREC